jgi:hypothetical protein
MFCVLDTLEVAKAAVAMERFDSIPENYKLSSLYYYVTNEAIGDNAHRAAVDVSATVRVMSYFYFWKHRVPYIRKLDMLGNVVRENQQVVTPLIPQPPNDDSDTDNTFSIESSSDDDSVENRFVNTEAQNVDNVPTMGWERNQAFEGVDSQSMFESEMKKRETRTTSEDDNVHTGLLCSKNSVNSPLKSWRQVFTSSILDKIVKYTNEYGQSKCATWDTITRTDLTDFISILFVSSIQKRKDKSSNWWSENPTLESPVIKKIMSGRKFHTILRYLHVVSIHDQPERNDPDYDPIYKVKELMDLLEARYNRLYVPGQALSLDESLIRAFGRIKFKVRIITKAARYGIKVYVLTDAVSAFVLKVIVYTGKTTYQINPPNEVMKKTVSIVRDLCEQYEGSYRTVYVDRFYTSIDLLKELDKMNLFVTGTVMRNCIPKELTIAKTSNDFRSMTRGDHKRHRFTYQMADGTVKQYGFVCWKDRDIVYGLTNECNTLDVGSCYRRSITGIIQLERPRMIEKYNRYMGGVDLADMRRLHCNSTLMGQNRWWLKLFFYLLDVGTANALVLYREAMDNTINCNIVEYKMKLVMCLVGQKINEVPRNVPIVHELVHANRRHLCAYCALFSKKQRTRFKCNAQGCNLPLCSVGTGRVEADCFALAHANEEIRKAVMKKMEVMAVNTNRRGK